MSGNDDLRNNAANWNVSLPVGLDLPKDFADWLVDPQEYYVEVTRLQSGVLETIGLHAAGETAHSPRFPDLSLPAHDLFVE